MTTKTTQELREAIEDLFINAKVDESEDSTYYANKAMKLIAKHEAELVEEIESGLSELYRKYPELRTAMHSVLYQERAKLTALTEKESKE